MSTKHLAFCGPAWEQGWQTPESSAGDHRGPGAALWEPETFLPLLAPAAYPGWLATTACLAVTASLFSGQSLGPPAPQEGCPGMTPCQAGPPSPPQPCTAGSQCPDGGAGAWLQRPLSGGARREAGAEPFPGSHLFPDSSAPSACRPLGVIRKSECPVNPPGISAPARLGPKLQSPLRLGHLVRTCRQGPGSRGSQRCSAARTFLHPGLPLHGLSGLAAHTCPPC